MMKFVGSLIVTVAVAFLVALAGAPAAQADGCPADQSVLDYSKNDPPYQCAVHNWSSKKSIGSWDTKMWSSDTALGYNVNSKCAYRSSNEVTWTWDSAGPSYWASFTNFAVSTRHFGTGVIFTTGSVNGDQIKSDSNCATGDGKIKNSIKKVTQKVSITSVTGSKVGGEPLTISGTVSPSSATGGVGLMVNGVQMTAGGQPVGGPIKDGKFTIVWTTPDLGVTATVVLTAAYGGDVSACQAAAKSCGFTGGASENVPVTIQKRITTKPVLSAPGPTLLQAGSTASVLTADHVTRNPIAGASSIRSGDDSGVSIAERSARMPAALKVNCPSGTVPLHTELFGANTGRSLKFTSSGASLKAGAVPAGKRAAIQVTCRKNGKPGLERKRIAFGTRGVDRMSTRNDGAVLLGGPGNDRLRVTRKGGIAQGGLGADRITVNARNGVAAGGPGADVIRANGKGRALLIGGPGRDRIVTSRRGRTLVDARDGQRDRVVCRGADSYVKADRKDILVGGCKRR